MMFPPVALLNRFYLGDSVLIEPIAQRLSDSFGSSAYIISLYPELFLNHPSVVGLPPDAEGLPEEARVIDMSYAIRSVGDKDGKSFVLPNKLTRLYEAAGLSSHDVQAPKLYLSDEEKRQADELRPFFGESCVGVILESRHKFKNWPYTKWLIRQLLKDGRDVFVVAEQLPPDRYLRAYKVHYLVGKPLRQLMAYLSFMDVVIGPDTGPMHIAGALGVPLVVITRDIWRDLYEPYSKCQVLCGWGNSQFALLTHSVRPRRVLKAATAFLKSHGSQHPVPSLDSLQPRRIKGRSKEIALFRLDGLGGTLTLSDQAKKIHQLTGKKSVVIVRGYEDAFSKNPYIKRVINVGDRAWGDCIAEVRDWFDTVGEIRFAIGKWHQQGKQHFQQDFRDLEGIFQRFSSEYRELEVHELHHVQLTDKTMGLPYDTIDCKIYDSKEPPVSLPPHYVVMNDGVDIQWGTMRQTKTWDGWNEFIELLDIPVVQVGTSSDIAARGAIDLRGKTDILELVGVLKRADAVVCCEGGLMHVAYAAECPRVVVLRGPTRGKLFEYPGHRFVDSYICDICWSSTDDWYARCPKGIGAVCMRSISPQRVAYNVQEVLCEGMA